MGRKEVAPKGQASEPNSAETFAGAFSFRENSITRRLSSVNRQNVNTVNTLEGGGALGIYTKLQSGVSLPVSPLEKRVERYALQSVARALLPSERVAICHRMLVVGRSTVDVMQAVQSSRVYFANLVSCGSAWVCPVCSAKIGEQRRMELREALGVAGVAVTMLTVTLQHHRGERLADVLQVLREGWKRTKAGRGWQVIKSRFGLFGYVTALEVTHGGGNGWHPHLHVLLWGERELSEAERAELQAAVAERFGGYVARLGGYVSRFHGVEVSNPEAARDYAVKWGLAEEVSKTASKAGGGRNPWQLLRGVLEGDAAAGPLFLEYAAAMRGRHQLQWSRGLRERLGLGAVLADCDAAAELGGEADTLLAAIPLAGWKVILANGERGELLRVATAGAESLRLWLAERGIVPAAL